MFVVDGFRWSTGERAFMIPHSCWFQSLPFSKSFSINYKTLGAHERYYISG